MKSKLIYLCVIITLLFCGGCSYHSDADVRSDAVYCYDKPQISPSGKYILEILNGYNGYVHYKRFNISSVNDEDKTNPKVVYCSTDTYRVRDNLYFVWDDNEDTVWVYSGDVGTSCWIQTGENQWQKEENTDREYPSSLVKLLSDE